MWLHQPLIEKGLSNKLARPWQGPYTIVKRLSDVVYYIQKDGKSRKRTVVHFNRFKPCFLPKEGNPKSTTKGDTRMDVETSPKMAEMFIKDQHAQHTVDWGDGSSDDEEGWSIPSQNNHNGHKMLSNDEVENPDEQLMIWIHLNYQW